MDVVSIYTTAQLNTVKSDLGILLATLGDRQANKYLYGIECDYECLLKQLYCYVFSIQTWQQNSNGTTTGYTNVLTQIELNQIIDKIREIKGLTDIT